MWTLALILATGDTAYMGATWLTSKIACEETGRASLGMRYRGVPIVEYKCTGPAPVTGIDGPILSAKPLAQQPRTEPK